MYVNRTPTAHNHFTTDLETRSLECTGVEHARVEYSSTDKLKHGVYLHARDQLSKLWYCWRKTTPNDVVQLRFGDVTVLNKVH